MIKITIEMSGEELCPFDVIESIRKSRMLHPDDQLIPFSNGEEGSIRDVNGDKIGSWKAVKWTAGVPINVIKKSRTR